MRVLHVDPGTRQLGYVLFVDGVFAGGGVLLAGSVEEMLDQVCAIGTQFVDRTVIEVPQVYGGGRSKGDPNDLIKVAVIAGAMFGRCRSIPVLVLPHAWKGSAPKKIVHDRALAKLSAEEAIAFGKIHDETPKRARPDLLDALSIGVWYREKK